MITEKEYEMIDYYRENYSFDESKTYENDYDDNIFTIEINYNCKAPIETILAPWKENKAFLLKLLGNNLIVSKKINNIAVNAKEIEEEYYKIKTFSFWLSLVGNKTIPDVLFRIVSGGLCNYFYDYGYNKIEEDFTFKDLNQEKPFIIKKGMKWTRVLGKVAAYFNIPDYEEFRIALSMAHQKITAKKEETLYLSIHPLDFMTMSDNDNNWESCMSWRQNGCYRAGTIAMMNSPCVLIAYLTSATPMRIGKNEWNNKKYRQLIIVDEKFLATVRPYPYESNSLDHEILSFVKELYQKNIDVQATFSEDYSYDIKLNYCPDDAACRKIVFDCGEVMYNDFCHHNHKISFREDIPFYEETKYYDYNGPSECVWCGQVEPSLFSQEFLLCDDCYSAEYQNICSKCGDSSNDLIKIDGEYYCPYCYEHYIKEDSFTGEEHNIDDMRIILLWNPDTQNFYKNKHGNIGVYAYYFKKDIPEPLTYDLVVVGPRKYCMIDILPVVEEDLDDRYTINYIDYWEDLTRIRELYLKS